MCTGTCLFYQCRSSVSAVSRTQLTRQIDSTTTRIGDGLIATGKHRERTLNPIAGQQRVGFAEIDAGDDSSVGVLDM